jgi:hypothetical protein
MNLNYISAKSRKAISAMIIGLLIYTINTHGRRYRSRKTVPITVEFVENLLKYFRW